MKNDFLCPHCRSFLNINEDVILLIKKPQWEGGLIMFSPELGNYTFKNHSSFRIDEGEHFEFLCPVCHLSLTSNIDENLAGVIMRDENHEESQILFSRAKGEQSTYQILKDHSVRTYGDHAQKYLNFVNLSMNK